MKMSRRWGCAVLLAAFATVGAARAEEVAVVAPGEGAEIQLKNGNAMRGTLISVEPGQRVIVIVAGEKSIIPWDDIAKIVEGPKAPAAPVSAPAATVPPAPSTKGIPTVHIESTWPQLELLRVDGQIGLGFQNNDGFNSQALSKFVCLAPCDKPVDGSGGHQFVVSAPGMYPSAPFRLNSYAGALTARVHGTSVNRFVGGVVFMGAGITFGLGGLMFVGMSYIPQEPTADDPHPDRTAQEVRTIGSVIGGVGLAMTIGGIILLSEGRTQVELIKSSRGDAKLIFDRGVFRF